ncbi:uncharacterized protein LOC141629048 [Silene latifolia]|uniref:uncharacterized protein LOC141629048 n=1 Tax=Silene latifolia TaxID=37657 RepID=UPI003D77386B
MIKSLQDSFQYTQLSKHLWSELVERFGQLNVLELYELKKELANVKQENASLLDYYGKIKGLWENIDHMDPMPQCTCGVMLKGACHMLKRMIERETQSKLIQLLMGLHAGYEQVQSSLLSMDPLPPINRALGSYKRLRGKRLLMRVMVLLVLRLSLMLPRKDLLIISLLRTIKKANVLRTILTCLFCDIKGHIIEHCYKFKAWKAKQAKKAANSAEVVTSASHTAANTAEASYNQDAEYTPNASTSAGIPQASSVAPDVVQGIVDSVMSKVLQALSDNQVVSCYKEWVIDTGASDHMTSDASILPNLLSVGKLISRSHLVVTFLKDICLFQDLSSKTTIAQGKRLGDLYIIRVHVLQKACNNSSLSSFNSIKQINVALFHSRLGHSSVEKMKHVNPVVMQGVNKMFCETCVLVKHHSLPFYRSISHAKQCFDLVHMDLWGPYRTPGRTGAQSFFTILDDYSRSTWTFLLQHKTQVPELIQNFINLIENQFSARVKVIRSYNGTEFFQSKCNDYCASKGIIHQRSIVGRPQQNGRVEMKHRHFLETARALRFHAQLPIRFWGDCLLSATYLINKMPSSVLNWQTPHELLFHTKPAYDKLRVFGNLCYATRPPTITDKFLPRARKCMFIGYPLAKKGYKLYNLDTNDVFVNRDVVFYEHFYPFKTTNIQQVTADFISDLDSIESPSSTINSIPDTTNINSIPQDHNNITPSTGDLCIQYEPSAGSDNIRRSSRKRQQSVRLSGYHCPSTSSAFHTTVLHQLHDFDSSYTSSLYNVIKEVEPSYYSQASKDPR